MIALRSRGEATRSQKAPLISIRPNIAAWRSGCRDVVRPKSKVAGIAKARNLPKPVELFSRPPGQATYKGKQGNVHEQAFGNVGRRGTPRQCRCTVRPAADAEAVRQFRCASTRPERKNDRTCGNQARRRWTSNQRAGAGEFADAGGKRQFRRAESHTG